MNLNSLNKIIVAVPDRLGDTLFSTPLLRLLKHSSESLHLDILAPTELAATTLQYNPNIEHIYQAIPRENYDLALDISDSEVATSMVQQLNCKLITYHDDKSIKLHSAEKLLRFFATLFDLELTDFPRHYDIQPQPQDLTKTAETLIGNNIDPNMDIIIGVHLGCHGLARKRTRLWNRFKHEKAWPLDKFIKLAKKLHKYNNPSFILTGSAEEQKLAAKFVRKIPRALDLTNKTTIHELAALINYCKVFISNDTGVMHLACATNTAVIALFGASNPTATGPYPATPNHIVIANPKISSISVASVFQAVIPYLT